MYDNAHDGEKNHDPLNFCKRETASIAETGAPA
jgi:hypothetical protein